MRALRYSIVEAAASLWRGRSAAAFAVLTIAAGLFLLGFFLLVNTNVERVVIRWASAAEMSVYLADGISGTAQARLEALLGTSPIVDRIEVVSKDQALDRFRRDFAELAALAREFEPNPLPASIEVRLRAEAGAEETLDSLVQVLSSAEGVVDVRYDRQWLVRLQTAVGLLRGVSLIIITIVGVAAALTVANVVRLAAYGRRDELEIMSLVGAPITFVRGPFWVEGVLQGGLGSVAAMLLLWVGFGALNARYGRMVTEAVGLDGLTFLSPMTVTLLVLGGMAVGCLGGIVAARGVR